MPSIITEKCKISFPAIITRPILSLKLALLGICVLITVNLHAQKKMMVLTNKPGVEISSAMWGVFFEDINFAADGGLYAELIKNRSFEFYKPLMGWKENRQQGSHAKILIINTGNAQNPRIAQISNDAATGSYSLSNEGFRGMGIQKNKQYNFSLLAKQVSGSFNLRIELVSNAGVKLGSASLNRFSPEWKKSSVAIMTSDSASKAHLDIYFEGSGTLDLDMISLFPKDTWKQRPNGLRADLVQMLDDLKPGFIRFPGGCIVEGHELETRYQWKKTVGSTDQRQLIVNRWNTEMKNRNAPDYFQSFGLGFYEYFQLAEDLGAAPLPILNCGMACQFNSSEVAPMDQLKPYIQDALDLIEFANGTATSKWGKLRAEMGHPAAFNLKLLGIGNEQWDEQYVERYKFFVKALKSKHPEIELVSSSGPSPDGGRFDYLWTELKKEKADIIDEHYYKEPNWFFNNASRYDNYDRKGPKVFAGEYAAHSKEEPASESRNSWLSALAEAAFMTGLERNADVVKMASYAPLFAHVEAWQWRPDLIWFDNLRAVGTPNYYVQKMFSTNRGSNVLPVLENGQILNGKDSIYASAVIDQKSGDIIIKLVNISSTAVDYDILFDTDNLNRKNALIQILSSDKPFAYNTLDQQKNIYPVNKNTTVDNNALKLSLTAASLSVIRIKNTRQKNG